MKMYVSKDSFLEIFSTNSEMSDLAHKLHESIIAINTMKSLTGQSDKKLFVYCFLNEIFILNEDLMKKHFFNQAPIAIEKKNGKYFIKFSEGKAIFHNFVKRINLKEIGLLNGKEYQADWRDEGEQDYNIIVNSVDDIVDFIKVI